MLDAFADVLATADEAVIADIWAGRDPDTTITSAAALAARHRPSVVVPRRPPPAAWRRRPTGWPTRVRPGRRRAGHGRRPVVRHRRAAGGGPRRPGRASRLVPMTEALTHGAGQDLLAAWKRAWEARDVDAFMALFAEDCGLPPRPVRGRRWWAPSPIRGHWNDFAARAVQHGVRRGAHLGQGPDGAGQLARRPRPLRRTAERIRLRGFLALDLDAAGLIGRLRGWPADAGRGHRFDLQAGARSGAYQGGGLMAGDVSFDVVSDFDRQELVNALDQARREIAHALRLQGRQGGHRAGQGRHHDPHRLGDPGQGDPGPHRVEGRQARPVAQDLRLGQDRAGRRQPRSGRR